MLRIRTTGGIALLAACSLALDAQAAAPGRQVYCGVEDFNLNLKLLASIDALNGDAVLPGSLSGSLQIYHQKVPRDRRTWSLEGRGLAQYWNTQDRLNLRLVLRDGDEVVDLTIETRLLQGTAGDYAGDFTLVTTDGVRVTGHAECSR